MLRTLLLCHHRVHYGRTLPPLYVPEHLVVHKDTHQAHVMIGSRGYNAYDDKRTALYLLNNVLGGPGTLFWEQNWRKGGLQDRRNQLLKEYDFYNQQYCGCEFSMQRLEKNETI